MIGLVRPWISLAACLMLAAPAWSQPTPVATDDDDLRRIIAEQAELIQRLNERVGELEARVGSLEGGSPTAPGTNDALVDAGADGLGVTTDTAVIELSEEERREQERLVRSAFQQTLIERGGLLLPSGAVDFEPSMSYLLSSSDNIVIDGFTILPVLVVGDIVSERVHRELLQASATARIGLPWLSQLDFRLPFSDQTQRRFTADNRDSTIKGKGIGDFEIGYTRQVTGGSAVWPDLLVSLRYKTATGSSPFDLDPDEELATGTGFHSINLALTGVKVVDPVVYFGSVSYSRNLPDHEIIGRYDPGDSTGISLGMAIALNLNSSISFAYDQQRTHRARVNGVHVPGSYVTTGVFSVGATFAVGDGFTTDLSLGIGTTADSPDVELRVAFPMRIRR